MQANHPKFLYKILILNKTHQSPEVYFMFKERHRYLQTTLSSSKTRLAKWVELYFMEEDLRFSLRILFFLKIRAGCMGLLFWVLERIL